jgi:hypothetical protein
MTTHVESSGNVVDNDTIIFFGIFRQYYTTIRCFYNVFLNGFV